MINPVHSASPYMPAAAPTQQPQTNLPANQGYMPEDKVTLSNTAGTGTTGDVDHDGDSH